MLQLKQTDRERKFPLPLPICSFQAQNELDDTPKHWGVLSAFIY
jgi:hypothetical protein